MPQPQVTMPQWNSLSKETREKIKDLFNLPKTGVVEVNYINGKHEIKCDGHNHADLLHLTVERMQEVTGSTETDLHKLLLLVADHVDSQKTDGDLLSQETLNESVESEPISELATPENIAKDEAVLESGKPCCGSKGTRHKKECETLKAKA